MKHAKVLSRHWKTLVILAICLSIPFIVISYIVNYANQDIFYEQKGEYLMFVAKMMDTHLGAGGYAEILEEAGVQDATREQKILALNEALREVTDKAAAVSEGLGTGYYSRELDAILTYGPSGEYMKNVGTPISENHPGREVMQTNTPNIVMGTMVRGNIMNAMYPIERGGEVIGYIWANELVSDLELALRRISTIVTLLLAADCILMIVIVVVFLRRMIRTEQESRQAIAKALEETQHLDRLMHIVNEAVALLLMADSETFEAALQESMQMMGAAFDVDNIYIWRNLEQDDGSHAFQLSAHWNGEDGHRQGKGVCFGPEELESIGNKADWRERLASNQSVKLVQGDLPELDLKKYSPSGSLSVVAIPVLLQEDFWGFVSYCDFHSDQAVQADEERVLFSGSLLMANAIARNEMMQRLVLAREEALSGTRAKSAFLASMSHEIRTPMNAITGMAAIGKAAADVERKDYAFGKIEVASTHLLEVINAVLDISKIESGKLEIAPVAFHFENMIRRVVDVTTQRMLEKSQVFVTQIDENIPQMLVADDQRLVQVIVNLLSNASKFTPEGGHIALSAALVDIAGNMVTIQVNVADSGIGIAPDKQERIFNSFEQAESSTTRKYGGTGLGLAISKNIVELMGGRIWVESVPGEGSTFSFTVQAECGGDEVVDTTPSEGDGEQESSDDFTGKHILLAEDVEINREILVTLLEPTNLGIDCAENGIEAVRMFSENPGKYDLVLMDVQMPEMDGYEATRRIRALDAPGAKDVPVIATTANVFKDDIERCLQAGMNGHLGKPLVLEEVMAVLRKYLH